MSPALNKMEGESQLPSIPIFQFSNNPSSRLRGRGRAAGLSSHEDDLRSPGDLVNVGVASLSIPEQIDRVKGALPFYDTATWLTD